MLLRLEMNKIYMENKSESKPPVFLGKRRSDIYDHKDTLRILMLDSVTISVEDEHAINSLQLDELYLSAVKLRDVPDERRQNTGLTMMIKIPTLRILFVDSMAVQVEDALNLETLIMSRSWENRNMTRFPMPKLSRLIARGVKFSKPITDELCPSLTDVILQKASNLELISDRNLNIEIKVVCGFYQDIDFKSCPNAKIKLSGIEY